MSTHPITSTMVGQILGLSPWGGPWQAWARIHGLSRDTTGNDAVLGHILEDGVAQHYAKQRGVTLTRGPAFEEPPLFGPEPWMATHPDYVASTLAGERWVVEVKTTRDWDGWGEEGSDEVPPHYAAQCAWHMACLGLEVCDLVAYCPMSYELRVYTLRRDLALEARLVARLRGWWERHVRDGETPPLDEGAPSVLAQLHASPTKEWLPATDEDCATAAELREVEARITIAEGERERLKAALMARIGDAYGIEGVARWSPRKGSTRIDAEALRRDHPEIADRYTVTGKPGRTFALLNPKE